MAIPIDTQNLLEKRTEETRQSKVLPWNWQPEMPREIIDELVMAEIRIAYFPTEYLGEAP